MLKIKPCIFGRRPKLPKFILAVQSIYRTINVRLLIFTLLLRLLIFTLLLRRLRRLLGFVSLAFSPSSLTFENPTMNNFDDADFDLVGVNDSNNVPSQQHLEPDPLVGNHYDPAIESNPTMNNFDDADFDLDGVNLTELLNFDDTNLSDLSTFIDDSNNVPSQQHLEPDPLVGNHVLAGYDRAIELVPNIHFEHYAPTEAEFQELMRAAALAREGASESIIHHLQPRKRARKRARVPPVVQLPPPPPQEPNAQPQEPNSQAHEPNAQAHPQAHPQAQAHPQVPNALSQEIFIATIAQAVENLLQPQLVAIEESQVRFEENQTKLAEKLDEISNFLNNHLNE